jgi:thymidylate kinase
LLTSGFSARVREGYRCLAQQEPQRWITIDASQPFESVQEQLRQVILQRLSLQAEKGIA